MWFDVDDKRRNIVEVKNVDEEVEDEAKTKKKKKKTFTENKISLSK